MSMKTVSSEDANWYQKVNGNFEKLVDLPFPIKTYADTASLASAKNPKLYKNCFALVGGFIYTSNRTAWIMYREQLTYIADLDTGTATLTDVKNAYNSLLADLRSKNWITT